MFNIDLAIKFGSNEIIIFRKGLGIIAKEPAYLAVEEKGKKIKVKATGKKAEKLFFSKSSDVTVYQPIQNSEIINEKMATVLMTEILKNIIKDKFNLTFLNALVAVPSAMSEEQLTQLKKVLNLSGINKVVFVQNAVCARKNLDVDSHSHNMVVDIGKFTTDISILNDYSFDFGRMYYIGGNDMDKSITTYIQDNHNLEVSDMSSEAIKNEIASLYDRDSFSTNYIGIDQDNKFRRESITANEIKVAIVNVYNQIISFIDKIIKEQPKEIMAEIYQNGILFVGGASKISGFYEYASKRLDYKVIVPEEPEDEVIIGAGKLLSEKEFLHIEL